MSADDCDACYHGDTHAAGYYTNGEGAHFAIHKLEPPKDHRGNPRVVVCNNASFCVIGPDDCHHWHVKPPKNDAAFCCHCGQIGIKAEAEEYICGPFMEKFGASR